MKSPDAKPRGDSLTPLRVLHLITDLTRGGAERFLLDLAHAVKDRSDVEFLICPLSDDDRWGKLTEDLAIEQIHYSPFSFRGPNDYSTYKKILDEFKPHVIHTHRFLAEFLSAQFVNPEIAYVCHGHDNMIQLANAKTDTWFNKTTLTNFFEKQYLVRNKYKKARTWFIANSSHTYEYYRSVLPSQMKEDVHLIQYGFDFQRFRTKNEPAIDPQKPLQLVNVGSFQDKKNQIFIVDIALELQKDGVEFEIHLLGDGQNRSKVQKAVEDAGLTKNILLHGNVDCVEEWLWKSDIYLHTAWYEPFGLVLLEAMAAGLPCVVLNGKGNRDVIVEGKNGYFIEKEDAKEFSEKLQILAKTEESYKQMSKFGIGFAEGFDMRKTAENFIGFYRDCSSLAQKKTRT